MFPEFKKVMKDIKCQTPLYIHKKYPIPEDISILVKDVLGAEMKKQNRGKFREQHASMLINLARNISISEKALQVFPGI